MLIETKLHAPPVRFFERPRLLRRCASGAPVTLVQAPAGYGKTTLLCMWQQQLVAQGEHTAWLTLDALDNDSAQLWRYVAAAVARIMPHSNFQVDPAYAVAGLLHYLQTMSSPITLCLDNAQVLRDAQVLRELEQFLMYLPAHMRVVLSSRTALELPIARWQVSGHAQVLGVDELRLEAGEFQDWCTEMSINPAAAQELFAQTEGWPAALELIRSLAQRAPYPDILINNQQLLETYVIDEIVLQQSPEVQSFLIATAVLEQFNAELAAAVVAQPQSQTSLHTVQQQQLFLVDLGAGWYRYQHFFAQALRSYGQRRQPELARQVRQQASRWYAAQNRLEAALEAALAAQDYPYAAQILEALGGPLLTQGRIATLQRWLAALPALEQPGLHLLQQWVHVLSGNLHGVTEQLDLLEAQFDAAAATPQEWRGQLATLRGQLAAMQGHFPQALADHRTALALVAAENQLMQGILGASLGSLELLAGEYGAAGATLLQAREASASVGNATTWAVAQALLGQLALEQNQLARAAAYFSEVAAWGGERLLPILVSTQLGLGTIAYERNNLTEAQQQSSRALELATRLHSSDHQAQALLLAAQSALAAGEHHSCQQMLTQLDQLMHSVAQPLLVPLLRTQQARIYLLAGHIEHVERWAHEYEQTQAPTSPTPQHSWERLVYQQYLLLRSSDPSLNELQQLWELTREREYGLLHWRTAVVMAQAAATQAQHSLATRLINQILAVVQEQQQQQLILEHGLRMLPLLQQASSHFAPLTQELTALLQAATAPLIILTPRERDVLRLVAAGATNSVIATQLVVSVGTVKTHLNNVYSKLEVNNRTAAIARARELKLLD